jgi:hypothetical protein
MGNQKIDFYLFFYSAMDDSDEDYDCAVLSITNGTFPDVDEVTQWFHTHKSAIITKTKANYDYYITDIQGIEVVDVTDNAIYFYPRIMSEDVSIDEDDIITIWVNGMAQAINDILQEHPMSNLSIEMW